MQFAVGAQRLLDGCVDAVLGRHVRGDRHDRQPTLDQRRDVVVEIFLGPAHRDDRRAGLGDHARHGGADTAARGAGHHDHATLETEQVIDHYGDSSTFCPDKIGKMRIIENMILCKWLSVKWAVLRLSLPIVWTSLGC